MLTIHLPNAAHHHRPALITGILHRAHDEMFRRVHGGTLVYNTCWEDPRLDREMLRLGPGSRVVTITSAGCNALDYLLDGPDEIHAVDVNPRQNALLHLKMAVIEHGDHDELFRVFGEGSRPGFHDLLRLLSGRMPRYAQRFWESKRGYFEPAPPRPGFYYRGAAGRVAWIVRGLSRADRRLRGFAERLVDAASLDEQRSLYESVRPALWNAFNSWFVSQPVTMAMMGVPRPQIRMIESQFPGGVAGYVQSKMERVLTRLPMRDNYFWRVYAVGRYSRTCCPNYLKAEHQAVLAERTARLRIHEGTLSRFLRRNPGRYSHYVLLDHQDWLASHDTEGLREEWDLLLANSRPGTRILMRSASPEIEFIPAAARERLKLFAAEARQAHERDRVGTYGSTLLAEVR